MWNYMKSFGGYKNQRIDKNGRLRANWDGTERPYNQNRKVQAQGSRNYYRDKKLKNI